jgi:hypothetical protein
LDFGAETEQALDVLNVAARNGGPTLEEFAMRSNPA